MVTLRAAGDVEVAGEVDLAGRVFEKTIRLVGFRFAARVDLSDTRFEHSLRIEHCRFRAGLVLRDVRIEGNLRLYRCAFRDDLHGFLDFRRLRVAGHTAIVRCISRVGIDLINLIAGDDLSLDGLHARCALRDAASVDRLGLPPDLADHLRNEMLGRALNLEGAEVRKHLYVMPAERRATRLRGSIDLRIKVHGLVQFIGVAVTAESGHSAITMSAAEVAGAVSFGQGTHFTGAVNLRAKIGGALSFTDATLDAYEGEFALMAASAVVEGSIFFNRGTTINGAIDLRAKVGGVVSFSGVTITADDRAIAVDMTSADVGGSVFFAAETKITGTIDLRATIGRSVNFSKATVTADIRRTAVDMSSAKVGGSVYFSEGTAVRGQIDLRGNVAEIVGFTAMTVTVGDGQTAVNMSSAAVGGSVFFDPRTVITGAIDLRAKIGGVVHFTGVKVVGCRGRLALDMESADVGGTVWFTAGSPDADSNAAPVCTRIEGHISLIQATLRGGVWTVTDPADRPQKPVADQRLNCRILGSVRMDFAEVTGPVQLHAISVVGRLGARHLTVHGDFSLRGSVIGHGNEHDIAAVEIDAATFTKSDVDRPAYFAPALDLELAEIHGNLWTQNAIVLGDLKGDEAEIVGEMNMDGCSVDGDLILRHATVKGRVFADEVWSSGFYPKVSGKLDLSYAQLQQVSVRFDPADDGTRPNYLNLTGATVASLSVSGSLGDHDANGTTIATDGLTFGALDCEGLLGKPPPPPSIRDTLRLVGALVVWAVSLCVAVGSGMPGTVWLMIIAFFAAWITRLMCEQTAYDQNERVKQSGLTSGAKLESSLLKLLDSTYPFNPGFYKRVEAWLRSDGNDVLADEVFLNSRRRENAAPRSVPARLRDADRHRDVRKEQDTRGSVLRQIGMRLVDIVTGYGVRPRRLATVWALTGLLSISVFSLRHSVERPLTYEQPRKDSVSGWPIRKQLPLVTRSVNPWAADGGQPDEDEWGTSHAVFMALRVQVPFLSLISESDWTPASRPMFSEDWTWIDGITFENYASTVSAMNLLVVPLTIAGLAGFLKRDK